MCVQLLTATTTARVCTDWLAGGRVRKKNSRKEKVQCIAYKEGKERRGTMSRYASRKGECSLEGKGKGKRERDATAAARLERGKAERGRDLHFCREEECGRIKRSFFFRWNERLLASETPS